MEENRTEVVEETNVVVSCEEKTGLVKKIGNGVKKVFSSKPAKIIGGVVLAAGGAVVGYKMASKSGSNEYDDYDEDFDEVLEVEDESAIAD